MHLKFKDQLAGFRSKMLAHAYRFTGNRDDAEDLIQETMLKTLSFPEKYSAIQNLEGMVFTVMRNTYINNYRREKLKQQILEEKNTLLHSAFKINEQQLPESAMACREIIGLVNRLDENHRQVFIMHIDGFKYGEIAETLSIPKGTVKSRIFSARRKLSGGIRAKSHRS